MVTNLSAFKELMLASSGGKSNSTLRKAERVVADSADPVALLPENAGHVSGDQAADAVSVELSASHDVFSAVDDFFNLGRSGRFDAFHKLTPADKEQFVKIVAELAKSGYVGYEELIVHKKVERHEILTQIGDDRLRNAKVYDNSKNPHS
ncbi:MAG: hypothetical protein WCP20_00650 [Desulfuromonadales bacterium]